MNSLALQRPLPDGYGEVTQWFGEHPEMYLQFGYAGHNGVDYGAPLGTPVLVAHAGRCELGHDEHGYGNWVKIHDESGLFYTLYAHLQSILAVDNEAVQPGMMIGVVGSTGNSTGSHLHWSLKVARVRNPSYGDWIDPCLGRLLNGDY
jgi:murein DD-endopeptidase MepM/ murein hydrolase activator NlpD